MLTLSESNMLHAGSGAMNAANANERALAYHLICLGSAKRNLIACEPAPQRARRARTPSRPKRMLHIGISRIRLHWAGNVASTRDHEGLPRSPARSTSNAAPEEDQADGFE